MVPCLEVVWICVVDVLSVLIEYLELEEVDALLEEIHIPEVLQVQDKL